MESSGPGRIRRKNAARNGSVFVDSVRHTDGDPEAEFFLTLPLLSNLVSHQLSLTLVERGELQVEFQSEGDEYRVID
jgi:hypothetical protein